jgi:hypothetical protein
MPCGSLLRHAALLVCKKPFLALVSMTLWRECREGEEATWYIEAANRGCDVVNASTTKSGGSACHDAGDGCLLSRIDNLRVWPEALCQRGALAYGRHVLRHQCSRNSTERLPHPMRLRRLRRCSPLGERV